MTERERLSRLLVGRTIKKVEVEGDPAEHDDYENVVLTLDTGTRVRFDSLGGMDGDSCLYVCAESPHLEQVTPGITCCTNAWPT